MRGSVTRLTPPDVERVPPAAPQGTDASSEFLAAGARPSAFVDCVELVVGREARLCATADVAKTASASKQQTCSIVNVRRFLSASFSLLPDLITINQLAIEQRFRSSLFFPRSFRRTKQRHDPRNFTKCHENHTNLVLVIVSCGFVNRSIASFQGKACSAVAFCLPPSISGSCSF